MSNNEILELKAAIMELTVNIKHMDTKQDEMLQDVKSIKEAIVSLNLKDDDVILITGSLYLAGEVLNQN